MRLRPLGLTLLLALVFCEMNSQVLEEHLLFTSQQNIADYCFIDVDSDNIKDLVFIEFDNSEPYNNVYFVKSLGNGNFVSNEQVLFSSEVNVSEIHPADFDSDGKEELLVVDENGMKLLVLDEDAVESISIYTPPTHWTGTGYTEIPEIATLDLFDNGLEDIVFTLEVPIWDLYENNKIYSLQNNGDFTFEETGIITQTPRLIQEFLPGDYNGDGAEDFLVNLSQGKYLVVLPVEEGNFDILAFQAVLPFDSNFCLGDFNSDGFTDMFSLSIDGHSALSFGDAYPETLLTSKEFTNVHSAGNLYPIDFDIDGDGDVDVLVNYVDQEGAKVGCFINAGQNEFSALSQIMNVPNAWYHYTKHDVDGDLDTDLVRLEDHYDQMQQVHRDSIYWYSQNLAEPFANFYIVDPCNDHSHILNSSISIAENTNYTWTMNGTTSTGPTIELSDHIDTTGVYNVTLEACNPLACDTITQEVTLNTLIVLNVPTTGDVNESLYFENNSGGYENFSWIMGDETVYLSQSVHHSYLEAGTYQVELFQTNPDIVGCTYNETWEITIGGSSHIEREEYAAFSVFPNPTNGYINLEIHDHSIINEIYIYNVNGQLVFRNNENLDQYQIYLDEPGYYLVEILSQDRTLHYERVVVY